MDQTETEYSTKVQIALLPFDFGLVETHGALGNSVLKSFNLLSFSLHVQSKEAETVAVVWPLTLVNAN